MNKSVKTQTHEQKLAFLAKHTSHAGWQAAWRAQKGDEPRPKSTNDVLWIAKHGADIVDIAHTDFADLPADWQEETSISVDIATAAMIAAGEMGMDIHSVEFMEFASAMIHASWRLRHGHEEWVAGSVLEGDYSRMPESEKEKDRVFVRCVLETFGR